MAPWPIAKLLSLKGAMCGSSCRLKQQNSPASRRVFCVCNLPFSALTARRLAPQSDAVRLPLSAWLLWIEWAGHYVTSNMHITQLAAPRKQPPGARRSNPRHTRLSANQRQPPAPPRARCWHMPIQTGPRISIHQGQRALAAVRRFRTWGVRMPSTALEKHS